MIPRHHDGGALRNRRTNKNAAGLEVLAALNSTLATSCPLPIGNRVNLLPSCTYARGGSHRCQAILTSAAVMYKALSFVQRSGRHAPDSTRTRMATRSAPTGLTVPPIPSTTSSRPATTWWTSWIQSSGGIKKEHAPVSFLHKKLKPIGACSGYTITSFFLPGHPIPATLFKGFSSLPAIYCLECFQFLFRVRLLHELGDADRRLTRQDRLFGPRLARAEGCPATPHKADDHRDDCPTNEAPTASRPRGIFIAARTARE